MIKKIGIFTVILIITFCIQTGYSDNNAWVAKIGDKIITLEDFKTRYNIFNKARYQPQEKRESQYTNSEDKVKCLSDMINEKLILKEAKNIGIHEKQEIKDLIKIYTEQIIIQSYIEEKFGDDVDATEEEINEYYEENRLNYLSIDPEMASEQIKQIIMLQKLDKKISHLIDTLKEKIIIDRNEKALTEVGDFPDKDK